ncbi:MAG: MCP four helix bundle domain-containing protein [Simplicispira suum]|uniref:methyl-accepting chemotaxis protein n=1 Tax=Simplicispira suum TaxID=2109915 RepID=UPI001C6BBB24|nr:methyl-accepting chemotaxis protein [Simplicispira suum]MBW7832008.1 MCP four helix bundle domain-containing protein [Simplicispira suum]
MIALAGKATSIRTRLYFATVFSLLLLVGVGLLGYVGLDRTRDTVTVLFKQHVQTLTDMSDLRTTLGEMRRVEKDIILNFNNAVEVASQREIWAKTLASLRARLAAVRTLKADDASFTTAIDKTLEEVKQYEDGVSPVFAQIEAAQLDGAGGAAYADKFKGHMEASDELLAGLATQARTQMDEARAGVDARAARLSLAMLAAVLLALAIVLPLTIFTLRSITASLVQARGLAEHIAAGDLSHDVAPRSQDELGQLVLTMGRMQESLRTLVRQVQDAAGNISTASAEIATGNMDLSQRTEQTAANLEEVAASMDMLTGTVQHNADNSRSASASAGDAGAVAGRGGEVVSQVVNTMEQISTSSRKISDITGVIDGIAFQTNILALNAAVEAARAGEQGRGFAVVASEVRSLAGRSADAAKEIKALIGASVGRVEDGARLVGQAGQTMTEIVGSVQRVSSIIGEISASAAEERDNIEQIGQAVRHLDQMTQQNAALVEQSAAASQSLREQAANLTRAVSQFKLGEAAAHAHAPQGAAYAAPAAPARAVANERQPLRLG